MNALHRLSRCIPSPKTVLPSLKPAETTRFGRFFLGKARLGAHIPKPVWENTIPPVLLLPFDFSRLFPFFAAPGAHRRTAVRAKGASGKTARLSQNAQPYILRQPHLFQLSISGKMAAGQADSSYTKGPLHTIPARILHSSQNIYLLFSQPGIFNSSLPLRNSLPPALTLPPAPAQPSPVQAPPCVQGKAPPFPSTVLRTAF